MHIIIIIINTSFSRRANTSLKAQNLIGELLNKTSEARLSVGQICVSVCFLLRAIEKQPLNIWRKKRQSKVRSGAIVLSIIIILFLFALIWRIN